MRSFYLAPLLLASGALGSLGDDLEDYKDCLKVCDISTCGGIGNYPEVEQPVYDLMMKDQLETKRFMELPLPWYLQLLGWKCYPNCDYQCQRIVTRERQDMGMEEYQFHGKWPFIRVFGIQEFFSALFSVGNFFPHYDGFRLMLKNYRYDTKHGLKSTANLYWAYAVVGLVACFAWFFSTIFHVRDTWNRERLDYFFAGMTVISGLYAVGTRVFKLYLKKNDTKRHIFAAVVILMYVYHVCRLLNDWSYTYNMQANVAVGLVENVLWITHALVTFSSRRTSRSLDADLKDPSINWTLIPIGLVLSVSGGMMFELFDFPPLADLLDAHALWHLATILPAYYWYPYMARDVEEGVKEEKPGKLN